MYANVIIEYANKKLNQTFTYKIPNTLIDTIKVGMKVYVPFNNQKIFGFVLKTFSTIEDNTYEIKEIIDVVDKDLVLNEELMNVAEYLSNSTLCTKITAFQTMLPSSLKIKSQKHNYALYEEFVSIKDDYKAIEYKNKYKQRTAQIKIIDELLNTKEVKKSNYNSSLIKVLLENDIIIIRKEKKYRININNKKTVKDLTNDQQKVYDEIINTKDKHLVHLLYGITGSGKTEVYIKLIEKIISLGKTAIMLVPEISLTTQIAKRFYEAFSSDVAILHSSLSEGEKYDEYLKILNNEVHVVVGTRSAIFAPLNNLGIIIIDEEDSMSYKQDNNPRYHARDIAIYRANYNNIPLVLGSATPSLESMARAKKDVYKLHILDKRVGTAILPKIYVVDMIQEIKKRNNIFSDLLKEKIKEKLCKNEQVILLLNRRGFSTFINCSNCGYTYKCPNCDITLTYHKTNNNLICHYCGYIKKMDNLCPSCGEKSLNYYGLGTEKLEEKIHELFSDAKVIRMDQDTTQNKGMHEKIINSFKNGEYNILLGTQMISKGLDFPNVSLVGIINADTTLNIPEYRSGENTFALLHQTAGRAGRSNIAGDVIIQTFNPDNEIIKYVSENNYDKFYNYEMNFRHTLKYPPYYYLVSLKIISKNYDLVLEESKKVKDYLVNNISKDSIVLGPTMAPIFKYNNEYRMQILIKYKIDNKLIKTLKDIDNIYINKKDSRIEIDFNSLHI